MSLNPGTRLGVYEVIAKIGEGGMGEVYQARDTTLDRDVALKMLPEAFTSDPDPPGPLRARSQSARLAEPPEHRQHLRVGGGWGALSSCW